MPFFEDDPEEDKGFFMVFCSVCGEWCHKRCENIPVVIFRDKKELLYGNARNVNKSRNMPSRTFLWSYHLLTRNSTHCKQRTVLLRATHIRTIILANFETKLKKFFLPSESSQENVHGRVHFWKSYRQCCLQFSRIEF